MRRQQKMSIMNGRDLYYTYGTRLIKLQREKSKLPIETTLQVNSLLLFVFVFLSYRQGIISKQVLATNNQ